MAILKVEPLTTARALRGPFDYRRPEAMAGLEVGSLVRVPFGPRRLLGVVVELADSSELAPERLAEPIEALEAGASAELVELGLWVAREYCSTPSRGLSLVLPPGTGSGRSGRTVRAKTELRAEITPAGAAPPPRPDCTPRPSRPSSSPSSGPRSKPSSRRSTARQGRPASSSCTA